MAKLRAAIITDVHYGDDHRDKLGSKAPRLMEQFIKAVNNYDPDCVVDLGDRVTGRAKDTDMEAMKSYRAHFNEIAAPFYSVLGNHDLKNLSHKDNRDIMGHPTKSYTRDVGGYRLVFWNPDSKKMPKSGIDVESESVDWLKETLKASKKPVVLFTHVPLDNRGTEGKKGITKNFYWTKSGAVRRIIEDAGNVALCMSGHRHKNRHREINGIHYITQQSFTSQWKKHYRIPSRTHSFLEAEDDKITVKLQGKFEKTYELDVPHLAP